MRTHSRRNRPARRRAGFTLLEILLVVTILAVIGGLVVTNIFSAQDKAFQNLAKNQISALEQHLDNYRLNVGSYPNSLDDLHVQPGNLADPTRWVQVLKKPVGPDPWNHPYEYKVNGNTVEIRCSGPDGQSNTEDDITNN